VAFDYLARHISYPLEREYEAWIMQQIDDYFGALGIPVDVFAVSPADEETWPTDEVVGYDGKIVGLQFKKPRLAHPPTDFSRLHWDFSSPATQLPRLIAHPEIFYCLPTFMNRRFRREALTHCVFWRPTDASDHRAWYENNSPKVKTKHSRICDAPRWGFFVEQFVSCKIGRPLKGQPFSSYLRSLDIDRDERPPNAGDRATLHVLLLRNLANETNSPT
jgi:hypothetical protein